MALRRVALLLAILTTGCVHPTVQTEPDRYGLPYAWPGSDELCVQQRTGRWNCIPLDDLRKLLGSMGKA